MKSYFDSLIAINQSKAIKHLSEIFLFLFLFILNNFALIGFDLNVYALMFEMSYVDKNITFFSLQTKTVFNKMFSKKMNLKKIEETIRAMDGNSYNSV